MDEYMNTYPAVSRFYEESILETEATGFSYTLIGRRRFHPEILSANKMDRWTAQRQATNSQIQGTAADVVRFAQLMIDAAGIEEQFGCRMLMQVHDELVFECPKETSDRVMPVIRDLMEHPFFTDLSVPLEVSMSKGPSWMHATISGRAHVAARRGDGRPWGLPTRRKEASSSRHGIAAS